MQEYVDAALSAGLKILGFSDHTPYFFPGDYYSTFRMHPEELPGYVSTVNALRDRYAGRLEIHVGVEAEYYPKYFDRLVDFQLSELSPDLGLNLWHLQCLRLVGIAAQHHRQACLSNQLQESLVGVVSALPEAQEIEFQGQTVVLGFPDEQPHPFVIDRPVSGEIENIRMGHIGCPGQRAGICGFGAVCRAEDFGFLGP